MGERPVNTSDGREGGTREKKTMGQRSRWVGNRFDISDEDGTDSKRVIWGVSSKGMHAMLSGRWATKVGVAVVETKEKK